MSKPLIKLLESSIELKGCSFTLTVIHLLDSRPELIRHALQKKIEQAPDFLESAPVVINISALSKEANWHEIHKAVISTGLKLVGISGCKDENQKQALVDLGLPFMNEGKTQQWISKKEPSPKKDFSKTQIIHSLVRSGQQIYARNSDLVVINNVSAGAELLADGNIHVYGIMGGRALAGASGDIESQIFLTHCAAELIAIAGEYVSHDHISPEYLGQAVHLRLLNKTLIFKRFDSIF